MTHGSKILHHFWDKLKILIGTTALITSQNMELKKMIKFCSGWQMMSLKRASFLHHVLATVEEKINPFKKIFSKIFTFCNFFLCLDPNQKLSSTLRKFCILKFFLLLFSLFAIVIKNGKPSNHCSFPVGCFGRNFCQSKNKANFTLTTLLASAQKIQSLQQRHCTKTQHSS